MKIEIVAYLDGFHKELRHNGVTIARCDVLDDAFIQQFISAYASGVSDAYESSLRDGVDLVKKIK